MRGLFISAHGGLERLEYGTDLPLPTLGSESDVRIRVRAAALNHLDLFVLAGMPGVAIAPPWIMGADATGVVDDIGAAVTSVERGDRVVINPGVSDRTCERCLAGEQSLCARFRLLGEHRPGTLAEYVVVPAANVRTIPRDTPDDVAAAFTLATLTAWRMIVTRARVRPGERVLIQGIGGGVALAAMQICRQIGASVWVTSRSDAKLARARELGAEVTINSTTHDIAKEVRARTQRNGMDVVVDSIGVATWAASLGALGRGGRLVACGATSGPMLETDARRLFWNQWTIMGSTMGNDAEFDAVVAQLRDGHLHPPIDGVYPLADGRAAFARLQHSEQFGKIVITI